MLERLTQSLARLVPRQLKANPAGEGNWHPGPYTVSGGWLPHAWGQYVNFWQMDRDPLAMPSSSIVEACVWAYVRAIAQLPGYHQRKLDNGGTETITTSALSRILRVPNGYQTASDFLVHLIRSLLLNGNSYWIAQRNDRQEVAALHWTDPRACRVREFTVQGQAASEIFYEIGANPLMGFDLIGRNLVVPARDVLHFKLATPSHPLVGETWLTALALELAARNAIVGTSSLFASNMSRPSGVLHTDLSLTKVQVDELRARWNEHAAGMNSGGVPILTQGLKFQPISMSNQDAQTIEQLKLNDRAVAAVFGVPSMLIGIADGGSVKSAEAQMTEWLSAGLGWLINHIEVGFDGFFGLPRPEYVEYDTAILLRAAFKERMDGLARAVQAGILAPNEGRKLEGYAAVDEGDEPRVQQQMVPLSFAGKVPAAPPAAPALPPPDQPNPDDERAIVAAQLRKLTHARIAA